MKANIDESGRPPKLQKRGTAIWGGRSEENGFREVLNFLRPLGGEERQKKTERPHRRIWHEPQGKKSIMKGTACDPCWDRK